MNYVNSKTILSPKNGINLYRGCTHGCIYCDSRSHCYGMEHEFEDVAVKANGLELLEAALRGKRKPCMIGTGSMSDPYMPLETELGYTRRCLELIERYNHGFTVITKSDGVLRDLDLLRSVNAQGKAVVQMTLTTFDDDLCRILEPNVCPTSRRIEVLNILRDNGIPTVVWLCPILPFINDTRENLEGILAACIEAKVKGIICFGMGLTLREGNREYFFRQLDRHFPGLKTEYIRHFGLQYAVNSPRDAELMACFHEICEKHGILHNNEEIFAYLNTFESRQADAQYTLWE